MGSVSIIGEGAILKLPSSILQSRPVPATRCLTSKLQFKHIWKPSSSREASS